MGVIWLWISMRFRQLHRVSVWTRVIRKGGELESFVRTITFANRLTGYGLNNIGKMVSGWRFCSCWITGWAMELNGHGGGVCMNPDRISVGGGHGLRIGSSWAVESEAGMEWPWASFMCSFADMRVGLKWSFQPRRRRKSRRARWRRVVGLAEVEGKQKTTW